MSNPHYQKNYIVSLTDGDNGLEVKVTVQDGSCERIVNLDTDGAWRIARLLDIVVYKERQETKKERTKIGF